MSEPWLIYGANGYTGELTARLAADAGLTPILAGRREAPVRAVAERYGFEARVASLEDPAALDALLDDVRVVLHCAGPFSRTSKPMLDACLRTQTDYLDITGEIEVFEAAAARDAACKEAGIMAMPGTGFDVVPSDCLAAYLAAEMPDATHLSLAICGLGAISHGTATTAAENLGRGGAVRRKGRITPVPVAHKTRKIDFGRGPKTAVTIPWGDISTAWHSTRIPNIDVYMAVPPSTARSMRLSRFMGPLLRAGVVQNLVKGWIDRKLTGPDDDQRARGGSWVWGEARNDAGKTITARLSGPEGYTLTALTSLEIVRRVLSGERHEGYQTPSSAYGPDLVTAIEGIEREPIATH
jgi:short subunit dehydrogenase-like uncharacterized protein